MESLPVLSNIKFNTRFKKVLISILLIIFIFSQYFIVPVYADTGYEGDFSTNELPYGIEFVKLAQSDGVGTAAIDKDGNIWTWGDAGAWLGQGSSYPGGACITPKKITTNIKFVDIIGNRDPQFMAIDINGNIWSVGRKSSKYVEDISTLTQFTSGTVYKKIHVLENAGGMAID